MMARTALSSAVANISISRSGARGFESPEATTITFRTAGEAGTQEIAVRIGKASGSGDREFFARRVGVDKSTMTRWIAAGKVPAFRTPGGHWRVRATDVDLLRMAK
jgi:excisionase family DNA binding protein